MKSFVVFALIVAVAVAAPQQQRGPDADAQVLKYDSKNIGAVGYQYEYETENGIAVSEEGHLGPVDSSGLGAIVAHGQFSYTGPNGEVYAVTYIADENGFQPQGAHLPRAPK